MNRSKNVLPILFSVVLLDQVAFGILLPIMSVLFIEYQSPYFLLDSLDQVQTVGYVLLGILFAIFPFTQFLTAPILGEFSDKFGRKPVLIFSILSITLAFLLFAIGITTKNIPLIFLARVLSGMGGGSIGAIFASVADVSTTKARTRNFGILASASGLGLILGPMLGGVLSDPSIASFFNLLTPLYVLTILGVSIFILVLFYLPETHLVGSTNQQIKWLGSLLHIQESYRDKKLRGVFFVSFMFSTCLSLFLTFGSVLALQRFSLSQAMLSYFLAYFGFWIIVTQLGLIGLLLRIAREEIILLASLLGISAGLLLLCVAPSLRWLFVVTPILALSIGLSFTTINSILSARTSFERQGKVLGVNTSVQSLAQAVPALLSGLLAANFSLEAPIIAGVIFSAVAGIYVYRSTNFSSTT